MRPVVTSRRIKPLNKFYRFWIVHSVEFDLETAIDVELLEFQAETGVVASAV